MIHSAYAFLLALFCYTTIIFILLYTKDIYKSKHCNSILHAAKLPLSWMTLAFVGGIHRSPLDSRDKRLVMRNSNRSFTVGLEKLLNKQTSCHWLACDVTVMNLRTVLHPENVTFLYDYSQSMCSLLEVRYVFLSGDGLYFILLYPSGYHVIAPLSVKHEHDENRAQQNTTADLYFCLDFKYVALLLWAPSLTWFRWDQCMDKWLHTYFAVSFIYSPMPQVLQLNHRRNCSTGE